MRPGNQSDIVKEFGVSRNAISLLVKAKDHRIIYTPSGKINIDATIEALRKSDFGARSRKLKATGKTKKYNKSYSDSEKEEPPSQEEIDSDPLTLESPREKIERHKAFHQSEKERINNEKSQKEFISVTDVSDQSFNLWRQVRDGVQSIKDRCAIKIRAADSDHEAEQILHDETHRILSSIVDGYESFDDEGLKKKLQQRLIR